VKPLLSRGFTRHTTRNFGLKSPQTRYPGTDLVLRYKVKTRP